MSESADVSDGADGNDVAKAKTRHVRINPELAEDLSWILQVLGKKWTSAMVLDPMLRVPIKTLYEKHREAIEALKKAQEDQQSEAERQESPPGNE